jgi:tetratricopeptide (TPR) repeat protein
MSSRIHARLGQWEYAYCLAQEGLQLYEQLQDRAGAALTHLHLGLIHDQRAEHHDAIRHSQTAHDLYQEAGNATGQALALNCLGWAHARLGEYAAALELCQRALPALQEAGDRDNEAGPGHLRAAEPPGGRRGTHTFDRAPAGVPPLTVDQVRLLASAREHRREDV